MITKIATGEIDDPPVEDGKDPTTTAFGKKGGAARASTMAPERPAEIARKAARKRLGEG